MAAAALMGGPSRCSHSNIIFGNVDISKVLVTFFAGSDTERARASLTNLTKRQNPIGPRPVWGIIFEAFSSNGLHIRIQRNELHILTPVKIDFDNF